MQFIILKNGTASVPALLQRVQVRHIWAISAQSTAAAVAHNTAPYVQNPVAPCVWLVCNRGCSQMQLARAHDLVYVQQGLHAWRDVVAGTCFHTRALVQAFEPIGALVINW